MIRRRFIVKLAAGCAGLAPAMPLFAGPVAPPAVRAEIGKGAPPFEVADTEHRKRTLAEFAGKPVVLEWTSPTCPFAEAQYRSRRMQKLQQWSRRKGVVWLSVLSSHPSRPDYLEPEAASEFDRLRGGVPTALLIDADGTMGHAYGALTANHMFVIDRDRTLVYAGGIDDAQSTKVDEVRRAHNHVRSALDDVLAGRKVRTPTSEPAGCAIAYEG